MNASFAARLRMASRFGAVLAAALFWTGCATRFTPTGEKVKVSIVLAEPVPAGQSVTFTTAVGQLTSFHLDGWKTKPGQPQNGRLGFTDAAADVEVSPKTFTLKDGSDSMTLTLEVKKGQLLGETVLLVVYDEATHGEAYLGAHAYSIEGGSNAMVEPPAGTQFNVVKPPKKGATPIKIK